MLREINPPYLTGKNYHGAYHCLLIGFVQKIELLMNTKHSCSIKKKVKKSGNTAARTLPNSPVVGRRSTQQVLTQPVDPGEALGWALVRYNYQAQQADELPLTKGSRVLVLEKSNDGWWRGQNASGQQVKELLLLD
jgi:SH3 domain